MIGLLSTSLLYRIVYLPWGTDFLNKIDHNWAGMDESQSDRNSADEYEEEECLVYLDFDAKFLEDQLKGPNLKMDIIGIDTDNPVMQVNSKIFRGKLATQSES